MDLIRDTGLDRLIQRVWEWKRPIAISVLWYLGLVYFRDQLELGEFYMLASGFWAVYMIGFSPRQPGELSAYSHFNENHQRILGDLDPQRAGRELTGQIMAGSEGAEQNRYYAPAQPTAEDNGYTLGRGPARNDEDDPDLQRALLISLREEREARKRKSKQSQ